MKVEDMSELKQLAIKHNHHLFRLAGICKTTRELINENQDYMNTPILNMMLGDLAHMEKQLKRAIEAKYASEREKATAHKRMVKTK